MAASFFQDVPERIPFGGLRSDDPYAFKVYQPDRMVLGKRMEDHLRMAVCYWHTFAWPGSDVFGAGTFDRPWLAAGREPMDAARAKVEAAFEFFAKLGAPFFCFHDRDIAPEGAYLRRDDREPRRHGGARPRATWSAPGSVCCGAPPTCSATRATRPAPRPIPIRRCSPTRRPR